MLDFGLAKANSEHCSREIRVGEPNAAGEVGTRLTLTGYMLGTPDYIAPEQIVNSQTADIRADIYGLGCTLYYLLSGWPPFLGSMDAVLRAHQSAEPKPLGTLSPEVPAGLAELVATMMAKSPAQRFQEPAEVVQALSPFVKNRISGAVAVNPPNFEVVKSDGVAGPLEPTQADADEVPAGSGPQLLDMTLPDSIWQIPTAASESGANVVRVRTQTSWRSGRWVWVAAAAMAGCAAAHFRGGRLQRCCSQRPTPIGRAAGRSDPGYPGLGHRWCRFSRAQSRRRCSQAS